MGAPGLEEPFIAESVVATIGVFDGLHRGHARLLDQVICRARAIGARSLVLSFDPHPVEVLAPLVAARRLTTGAQKRRLLAECGIDAAWLLPFSRQLASLEPEAFLDLVLRRIELRELWIGPDFRFGKGRRGDADLLHRVGPTYGFETHTFPPVQDGGGTISSTRIRDLLQAGEVEGATELLGHTFVLESNVRRGRGEGAKLLVATANLIPDANLCVPGRGVYAGWAEIDGRLHPAAINVGRRPTLTEDLKDTVEVHVIDWTGDLREKLLPVYFGCRLREERRFSGLEELRAAVRRDIELARAWVSDREPRIAPPLTE